MSQEQPQPSNSIMPLLYTDDIQASIDYYKHNLGWEERMSMPGPDGKTIIHTMLGRGQHNIMYGLQDEMSQPQWTEGYKNNHHGTGTELYVPVTKVDEYYNEIREKAQIVHAIEDKFWGDRVFTVKDNNGFYITFAENIREVTPEEMMEAMKQMQPSP